MATRSTPTVSWRPVSIASLSLVPTPSVVLTRMGSWKAGRSEVEERAEAADASHRAGPGCAARERLDALDERVARCDIDARVAVGGAITSAIRRHDILEGVGP